MGLRRAGPVILCPVPPEHQNFFGLDEVLGPVAVSLRREEKEGSGGGTLHSYRFIVRTTQVGRGNGIRPRIASSTTCMEPECPYIPSSAPDPPWHHLRGCTAARAPAGPVAKETSGACGAAAEPNLPAPGLSITKGATHTAHAGRASGEWWPRCPSPTAGLGLNPACSAPNT